MNGSVLIIDDDAAFRFAMAKALRRGGYSVSEASSGEEADNDEEQEQDSYQLSSQSYEFFKTFLIPSLSLFPTNPAVATELWYVLKRCPYGTRYRLYEAWRGIGLEKAGLSSSPSGGKPLPNVLAEMEAGKAARYVLKRLSKDNVRDMGRQLVKVTHANPLVVYTTILNQIESYDNLVNVMVESQRFANPLGMDVLGYCILGRLSGSSGGVNRSRLKGMRTYCDVSREDILRCYVFHRLVHSTASRSEVS